ncbi:MAG: hypothetical protein K6U02_11225 [Firmicutes bacterium]|nr:hypothetical protein [Bacillota bacterium]
MATRILLAGVVGGLVLFVWGAVSHRVLGLGEIGISTIPDEDAVLAAIKENLSAPGFCFFPGEGMSGAERTEEQIRRWEEKYRTGPVGVLVYDPVGEATLSPARLGNELLLDIAAALVATVVLSQVTALGFSGRVGLADAFPLMAALDIHGSELELVPVSGAVPVGGFRRPADRLVGGGRRDGLVVASEAVTHLRRLRLFGRRESPCRRPRCQCSGRRG